MFNQSTWTPECQARLSRFMDYIEGIPHKKPKPKKDVPDEQH